MYIESVQLLLSTSTTNLVLILAILFLVTVNRLM